MTSSSEVEYPFNSAVTQSVAVSHTELCDPTRRESERTRFERTPNVPEMVQRIVSVRVNDIASRQLAALWMDQERTGVGDVRESFCIISDRMAERPLGRGERDELVTSSLR